MPVNEPFPPGKRLDSWKAIAEYLQRDRATVGRWEKLGLPVRRVAGSGRSVFAYTADIDKWLQTTKQLPAVAEVTTASSASRASVVILAGAGSRSRLRQSWWQSVCWRFRSR